MNRFTGLLVVACLAGSACANTYYVATNGLDSNTGAVGTPFLTIQKAADTMGTGDVCIIAGGTYRETVTVHDNNVTFRAADNAVPVISAFETVTGWIPYSNSIYVANLGFTNLLDENSFIFNDTMMDLARWPNKTNCDPFDVQALWGTGNNTSISNADIPNWNWGNGGVVWFLGKTRWTSWRRPITSSAVGAVFFNSLPNTWDYGLNHNPENGGEFYLMNILEALDSDREWYIDRALNKIYFQAPGGVNPNTGTTEARKRTQCFAITNRTDITLDGLKLVGGSLQLINADNCVITNCTVLYGNHTIDSTNASSTSAGSVMINYSCSNTRVTHCNIQYGAGYGLQLFGKTNMVDNCYIGNFNTIGCYAAPVRLGTWSSSDNSLIRNEIWNGGRDVISSYGVHNDIGYNNIHHGQRLCDDSGLIYASNYYHKFSRVHHNWFHDTSSRDNYIVSYKASGVYLDNSSREVIVDHNVFWNLEWSCVVINWAGADLLLYNNTMWNNSQPHSASMSWWANGYTLTNVPLINTLANQGSFVGTVDSNTTLLALSANPFADFANQNFMPTNGSAPENAGVVVPGYTDGYIGSAPDCGAYEYGATPWVAGPDWKKYPAILLPDTVSSFSGCFGGPWTPDGKSTTNYTLLNSTAQTMTWSVVHSQPWVSVTPESGTINPGVSTIISVSINSNTLTYGVYTNLLTFSNGFDNVTETRQVILNVAKVLRVTPITTNGFHGPVGGPFTSGTRTLTLTNQYNGTATWSLTHTQSWLTCSSTNGGITVGRSGSVVISVNSNALALPAGWYADTLCFSNTADGLIESRVVMLGVGEPDYFTEVFDPWDDHPNDLANMSLTFTPDGLPSYYSVCRAVASSFPSDPTGGTVLATGDSNAVVTLSGSQVSLYGVTTNSFYVGKSGTISFGNENGNTLLENHFNQIRVSALFVDLYSGQVTWRQLLDRVAITWLNVTDFDSGGQNSFQVELFFDGRIRITWLDISPISGVVGLSRGTGIPADFVESDVSGYSSCAGTDLRLSQTSAPDPALLSRNLTYTLTVTNLGPLTATNVVVMDGLPSSVTFQSATASQGTVGTNAFGQVVGNLGTLGSNGSATVSINVTPMTLNTLTNIATVSTWILDAVYSNDITTAIATVIVPPLLAVSSASYTFGELITGAVAQASFTVTNLGDLPLTGTASVGSPFGIVSGSSYVVASKGSTNVLVSFTPPGVGTYADNVIFASDGGNTTNPVSGTCALDVPVASFTGNPTNGVDPLNVTFLDTSTAIITNRAWDFGDGATTNTTATIVFHTYQQPGSYAVSLVVSGPLGVSSQVRPNYITVTDTAPATVTATWTNPAAGGNWSTPANWDTGSVPDNNANVIFGSGGGTSIVDGVSRTIGNVLINRAGSVVITNSGGAGLTLRGGVTVSNSFANTLAVPVTLKGENTWSITNGGTLNASGAISGGGSLVKTGSGVLTLSGSNTYSGSTLISGGTLELGDGGTLGNGAVTNNAALVFNSSGAISVGSMIAGSGTLTKQGSGTLTLAGTNTYLGATTISAGTLTVNGGQVTNTAGVTVGTLAGTVATLVVTNGGTVYSTDRVTLGSVSGANSNRIQVTGTGSRLDFGGKSLYFGADFGKTVTGSCVVVENNGVVTNVGGMTLGYGDYSAGNSVIVTNGGKLYGGAGSIGYRQYVSNNWVYVGGNGAAWNVGGGLEIGHYTSGRCNYLLVDGGGIVTNVSTLYVGNYSGTAGNFMAITNGGQVYTKSASAIGNASGANSNYVNVAGGNALWNLGNQTLAIGKTGATGNWMTVASGGILTNGSVTFGGLGSVCTNGGDAYLSGINLANSDSLWVFNGGTLHATAAGNILYGNGTGVLADAGGTIDDGGKTATVVSVLSGAGALTKTGGGTLALTGANGYSGGTMNAAGTLVYSNSAALGSGTLAFRGGTLKYGTGFTDDLSGKIKGSTGAIAINDNGQSVTFASVLDSGNSGGLAKLGSGTLTLSGANAYSGATTVNDGTIVISNNAAFGIGTVVMNGGSLTNGPGSWTLGNTFSLAASAMIGVGGGDAVTLNGAVTNAGALTKAGSGTLVLAGANTYSGVTAVSNGTLVGVTGGSCSNSFFTVLTSATCGVQVATSGGTWACKGLTNNANSVLDFNFLVPASVSTAPLQVLQDLKLDSTVKLIIRGGVAGTNGAQYPLIKYTGTLSGTVPTSAASLPAGVLGIISNNTVNRSIDLVLTNNSAVYWAVGDGNWDINTTMNWKAGATSGVTNAVYFDGEPVIFDDSASGTGTILVTNMATTVSPAGVTVNSAKDYTISGGPISGSGALTKAGSGTLTLTGTNNYTGATTVSAGTLTVSGGAISNTYGVYLNNTMVGSRATLAVTNGGYVGVTSDLMLIGSANYSISNRIYVGGADAAGTKATLNLNGKMIYYGYSLSAASVSNNQLYVDQGGVVTNMARVIIGNGIGAVGNSLIITNGGQFHKTSTDYLAIGGANGAGYSNWVYVGGSPGPGAIALLNLGGGYVQIANGANGVGNYVMVDGGGVVTNGRFLVGTGSGAVGNYMVITNGGLVYNSAVASTIGYGTGANSNSVWMGSTATPSVWNLRGTAMTIGSATATGNWMTVASGGILTNGSVSFGGVGSVCTNGGDAYLSGVNLANSDSRWVFNGGALHATADGNLLYGAGTGILAAAGGTIDDGGKTATVAVVLSGAGALTKTGTGFLVLTNANTYSGATTVSNGTLEISGTGVLGGGNYAGAIANLGTILCSGSATQLWRGVIAGTGTLRLSGSGTLTLSGTNTYSGATTVDAGKLVGITGGSCSNSAITVASGATGSVQVVTSGGQFAVGGLVMNNGSILNLRFDAVPSTATAPLFVNGNAPVFSGTVTLQINGSKGIPAGTYPLVKYSGEAGSIAGISLSLPAWLVGSLNNNTGAKTIELVVTEASKLHWAVGTGNWDTGTLNWKTPAVASSANAYYSDGLDVIFDDNASETGILTVNNTAAVSPASVTVSNITRAYTISGSAIEGNTGLDKQGSGTATLGGVNTYGGDTRVSDGTLLVNGSIAYSPCAVSNGATLGGTGTVGTVTVVSGATLAPGIEGVGTLAAGAVTLQPGSVLAMQINYAAGTSNRLAGSAVTISSGAVLSLTDTGNDDIPVGAQYTLVTGVTGDGQFSGYPEGLIFLLGRNTFQITYQGGTVVITRRQYEGTVFTIR